MRYAYRPVRIAVLLLLASHLASSQSKSKDDLPAYILSSKHLQTAGYHLPLAMPTLGELMKYQDSAKTHQELKVHWQLFRSEKKEILKEDARKLKFGSEFELLDRKQSVPGIPGKTNLTINDERMVICAID